VAQEVKGRGKVGSCMKVANEQTEGRKMTRLDFCELVLYDI
jgi:hypothetical protein